MVEATKTARVLTTSFKTVSGWADSRGIDAASVQAEPNEILRDDYASCSGEDKAIEWFMSKKPSKILTVQEFRSLFGEDSGCCLLYTSDAADE